MMIMLSNVTYVLNGTATTVKICQSMHLMASQNINCSGIVISVKRCLLLKNNVNSDPILNKINCLGQALDSGVALLLYCIVLYCII